MNDDVFDPLTEELLRRARLGIEMKTELANPRSPLAVVLDAALTSGAEAAQKLASVSPLDTQNVSDLQVDYRAARLLVNIIATVVANGQAAEQTIEGE